MTDNPLQRKAAYRLEVVAAYLRSGMAVTVFAQLFNAGGFFKKRLDADYKETGPIDAEDLDRWADICMGVVE